MKLTLKNDKKYVAIEFPQSTSQDLTVILDRAFDYISGTVNQISTIPHISVNVKPDPMSEYVTDDNSSRERAKQIINEAIQKVKNRSKVLPKVNVSEPTLFTNIGEKFGDKLQQAVTSEPDPEHWVTGIQFKDFDGEHVPCYRTYYYCPQGHKGKRYIPENTDFVHCHTCNSKIGVRLANEDGFPNRDGFGNFYIADQPWEEN